MTQTPEKEQRLAVALTEIRDELHAAMRKFEPVGYAINYPKDEQ